MLPHTVISFDQANSRFNLRAAGVYIHNDYVLLTTSEGEDYWFLPGGRIELSEDTKSALGREMSEEIGCEVEITNLLWVVEDFFELSGKRYHEVCFVYEILPTASYSINP